MKVNSGQKPNKQYLHSRLIHKYIGSWIIVTFNSKNSLIHLLDDEYKESDEEVQNLITHSYYCCSKDLFNNINCVDGTTILTLNCQSLSAKYDSLCIQCSTKLT